MAGAFVDQARGELLEEPPNPNPAPGTEAELTKNVPPSPWKLGETTTAAFSLARNESERPMAPGRPRNPPRPPGPVRAELVLDSESSTNSARTGPGGRGGFRGRPGAMGRSLSFLANEKAAVVVSPSFQGDGGTFFVSSASVPGAGFGFGGSSSNSPRAWSTNAPAIPPQITLAAEDYNRLVRIIQHGENLKMAVDLQVQFHDADLMAYNTVAEIPGSDLKNEVV